MILPIVHYDAPILRAKGKEVGAITPEIESLIADLFDTMRQAHGVGLAAQQIGEAIQVAVIDITGVKERPSKMWIAGKPVDPDHLGQILTDKKAANPAFEVAMKADEGAPFKIIVKIMDAANQAHIPNLKTYMSNKSQGATGP